LAQSVPPPTASFYACSGGAFNRYVVPDGITHIFISMVGAAGSGDSYNVTQGGLGALVEATVPVQPGDELGIIAGCAANQQTGGIGGDGADPVSGGRGGNGADLNVTGANGGAGGGPSGVFVNTLAFGVDFVVAGGGGGGGGSGSPTKASNGESAGLNTAKPQDTSDGGRGLGSTGGGGGGGGGGGYRGGAGGGGGNRLGGPGKSGDGGSSHVPSWATSQRVVKGGGPRGDGFVVLQPLPGVRPAPVMSYLYCKGSSAQQPYTVPAGATSLQVLVNGAAGEDKIDHQGGVSKGGRGAGISASLGVSAGQTFNAVVGCMGTSQSGQQAGVGFATGGNGGNVSSQSTKDSSTGGGGGGASALLDNSKQALLIAGAGGGAGGFGNDPGGDGGNGSLTGVQGDVGHGGHSGAGGTGGQGIHGLSGDVGSAGSCPGAGGGGGGGAGAHGGGGGNAGTCGGTDIGAGGGGGGGSSSIATDPRVLAGSVVEGASGGDGTIIMAAAVPGVPTAPFVLQATGATQRATVTFTTPSDDGGSPITSYTVTSNPDGMTATGNSNTLTVTGLNKLTPYTFTVHANNAIGKGMESGASNPVSTIFVPGAPGIGSVTGGDGQATVSFSPPVDNGGRAVTSYTANAHQGGLAGPVVKSVSGTASPLTITGLTNGTSYTVGLIATNAVGNSGEGLGGVVVPLGLPGAPTDVSATVVPGGISVSFSPPLQTGGTAIDSYAVTSSSDGKVMGTGSTSPILVTGLTNGLTYVFTVHATTRAGNGPESAPTVPIHWTSNTALSPPLFAQAVASNHQAIVTFQPPLDNGGSPVTSYTVTSNPGGVTASGPASPITVTGLTNGVSYTFTVVANNANGSSQPSDPSNAVTPRLTEPGQPPAPVALARDQAAIVNVTPPAIDGGSPITAYTVTSNPGGITATSAGTSIVVPGLTDGTSYTFTVVATNGVGNSQPSAASNAVTPSASAPPLNDNFASAQVITGDSGNVSGTNVNATTEPGEPLTDSRGASVWYVWNVSHGGVVQMDTCNSSFSPLLAAYTGNSVNALTPLPSGQVAVFCGNTGTFISSVQFTLPPNGGTIYFAVEGGIAPSGPVEGTFSMGWGQGGG
jgi:hypothetical protein